ncbi:hypothetical protein [Nocardia jiangsuensis]|uniref:Uncharacterized protein n=1 Tax=Nocardia jiangsuensis TaxID=1691563 RepID=A0ABV8DKS2_9NOCA
MSIATSARRLLRYGLIGFLVLVGLSPLIVGGLIAWNQIRIRVDPPAEMRHATATEVSGFEEVSLSKADLGGLQVTRVFLGPVVERPRDHITSPGAGFTEKSGPSNPFGESWILQGNYPDDCFVSVYRIYDGRVLRGIEGLSDIQRSEVSKGEKMVLQMKFACGRG